MFTIWIGVVCIEFIKYSSVEPWFYQHFFWTGYSIHFGVYGFEIGYWGEKFRDR